MSETSELLKQAQNALGEYIQLSILLFGDNAIYDINELEPTSPFYETAKEIAEDMGLDWNNMTHEDSNRLMLNMLGDYFAAIKPVDGFEADLTISMKKAGSK